MRFARRMVLFAAAAVAALGLSGSSASAVELVDESASQHCSAVSPATHTEGSGGCQIGIESEGATVEIGTPVGMLLCGHEFEGRLDESGAGYIYNQAITNCSPIAMEPCLEDGETENWPIVLNSPSEAELQFCVDLPSIGIGDIACHLPGVQVSQPTHGIIEFATDGHQACEVSGYTIDAHWVSASDGASHPELEIAE